jgi:hypothetical protein
MSDLSEITAQRAEQVIESLRNGIPPTGLVSHFTVGRKEEVAELEALLDPATRGVGPGHLIKANYGSGKTHLLRVIEEKALQRNYVVANVTVDANNGVRFNRMDQVLGRIYQSLESQDASLKGIDVIFNDLAQISTPQKVRQIRPDMVQGFARQWVGSYPWMSKDYIRNRLHNLSSLDRGYWSKNKYEASWMAIENLNHLAVLAGHSGVVLLFDEFEDIFQNLNNSQWQQTAFENFFNFFDNFHYSGLAFFAVTPEFVQKSKSLLRYKGIYGLSPDNFDHLPQFSMSPITESDVNELAIKICNTHGIAYEWPAYEVAYAAGIEGQVHLAFNSKMRNQTRLTIESIVCWLDGLLQSNDD